MFPPASINRDVIVPFSTTQAILFFLLPTAIMNLMNEDHGNKLEDSVLWDMLQTTGRFGEIAHPIQFDDEELDSALSVILQEADAMFEVKVSLFIVSQLLVLSNL